MITLRDGKGELPFVYIQNRAAKATLCLLGATIQEYQPAGHQPVLWTSPNSHFEVGTPIRGGIPVCWPWFGTHPTPGYPAHGLVRTLLWELAQAEDESDQRTLVELSCHDNADTRKLWPHAFQLRLRVEVGTELRAALIATNPGPEGFPFSGALHTYFAVSDVRQIHIDGLDGVPFLNKVRNFQRFVEPGPVRIAEQVDRVYLDTDSACTIYDPGWQRRILVEKEGSRTTVVWNPWARISAEVDDLGPEMYQRYVCVESVVGPQEEQVLPAGASHTLATRIRVEEGDETG